VFASYRFGNKIDNSEYSRAVGQIWLDNVQCTGDEEDIGECTHSGWGVHDCEHREDVAISCENITGDVFHIGQSIASKLVEYFIALVVNIVLCFLCQ